MPVRVVPEGNTTMTTYGVREELDLRGRRYNTGFHLHGAIVDVEVAVWEAQVKTVENVNVTLDGPLAMLR